MSPGINISISKEVWLDYKIFIACLKKKTGDLKLSASKRIEELIKKDMEENK